MNKKLKSPLFDQLFKAVIKLDNIEDCYNFFEDVCYISELQNLAQRLEIARLLNEGKLYSDIANQTGASTATISRIKQSLIYGADGYRKALANI